MTTFDYLNAATLYALGRPPNPFSPPASFESLYDYLVNYYGVKFEKDFFEDFFDKRGESLGIKIVQDKFAGNFIEIDPDKCHNEFQQKLALAEDNIYRRTDIAGKEFVQKFMVNTEFWRELHSDLEKFSTNSDMSTAIPETAPASDRIVKVNDNQFKEIDEATEEIVKLVSLENAIGDDEGLRERILGQINAARELVRHGSVKAYLLYQTIVEALQFLILNYAGTAIGEAAKVLLTVYLTKVIGE